MSTTRNILKSTVLGCLFATFANLSSAQDVDGDANPDASPEPAILIADDLRITADDKLIAIGNVEALRNGQRLHARQVIYDRKADTLEMIGPITITDENGNVSTADSGTVDRDFQNAILYGARVVMDGHVQLAANEMHRVQGRYSQMYKAAVTSCRICKQDSEPLWQIRAMRVIHDKKERQLYFHNAQFRILDMPVFYMPRLRLPDPTLDRATGFLAPSLHKSSRVGFGARIPYFIKIGDHRDLTLTPFITTKTLTMEYRYRQAFYNGEIQILGAVSDDNLTGQSWRGYMFADGVFDIQNDFKLTFDVEAVRDETYLLDYDYSDKDRLDSEIAIERVRRDERIRTGITYFHSLRDGESNKTLPTLASEISYERRFFPQRTGGELRFSGILHGHRRTSDLTTDGPDYDMFSDGHDVARLNLRADWRRNWTFANGMRSDFRSGLALDTFRIHQAGDTSKKFDIGATPYVSAKLSWPWQKAMPNGAVHIIEPTIHSTWIGGNDLNVPNDESTRVEFDEGNLFDVSRFPTGDRWERGMSAAYGASWTRFDPKGWQSTLAAGQVWRNTILHERDDTLTFTKSSGLQEHHSDFLVAMQFANQKGISLTARGIFDGGTDITKAEARAAWRNKRARMSGTYIWLDEDPAEDRRKQISEFALEGSYRVSRHWTINGAWRYDVAQDESIRAKAGMEYTNECVSIGLTAGRRFTSSTNLEPSTDISLTVALRGFTAKTRDESYTRRCRN